MSTQPIDRLLHYFTEDLDTYPFADTVGAEVETQFVNAGTAEPVSLETSQRIFEGMIDRGWQVATRKGSFVTELVHGDGDRLLYELGRHNLELSLAPQRPDQVASYANRKLDDLCAAAAMVGALPWEQSILPGTEDLLAIPDERDAAWLELDGREALKPLARTSSVQFVIDVPLEEALEVVNRLGKNLGYFLAEYPQEAVWRQYIKHSKAPYRGDRYGGPTRFQDFVHYPLRSYCNALLEHDVIVNGQLVPQQKAGDYDITLFLRSIWWYFRLRRYGRRLCVEVRPLPRRHNYAIATQLAMVLRACKESLGTIHYSTAPSGYTRCEH